MTFIPQISAVEADGFCFQLTIATMKTIFPIIIREGNTLITLQFIRILYKSIIADLVHGMMVAEAITTVFAAFYSHPDAILFVEVLTQIAHALHQFIVLYPVRKGQTLGRIDSFDTGCWSRICRPKRRSRNYFYFL